MTQTRILVVLAGDGCALDHGVSGPAPDARVWQVFADAGFEVDVARGAGCTPTAKGMRRGVAIGDVDPARYAALCLFACPGRLSDAEGRRALEHLVAAVYERGGVVSAVHCGACDLTDVLLSDGQPLVAGRTVTGCAPSESTEPAHSADATLSERLRVRGARYVAAPRATEHLAVDGRLVTGQNTRSAAAVAREVVAQLSVRSR